MAATEEAQAPSPGLPDLPHLAPRGSHHLLHLPPPLLGVTWILLTPPRASALTRSRPLVASTSLGTPGRSNRFRKCRSLRGGPVREGLANGDAELRVRGHRCCGRTFSPAKEGRWEAVLTAGERSERLEGEGRESVLDVRRRKGLRAAALKSLENRFMGPFKSVTGPQNQRPLTSFGGNRGCEGHRKANRTSTHDN